MQAAARGRKARARVHQTAGTSWAAEGKSGFESTAMVALHTGGSLFATEAELVAAANNAIASQPTSEMRAELEAAGVVLPTADELEHIARRFNDWLEAARKRENKETHSWFQMFNDLDEDGSGNITFDELRHATRSRLKVTPSMLSEEAIKAMWCALDVDNSNAISAAEFGAFLKRVVNERMGSDPKGLGGRQATMHTGGSLLATDSALVAASNAIASQPTSEMRAELEAAGIRLEEGELGILCAQFVAWLDAAHKAMPDKQRHSTHSWANIFNDVDVDRSGFVTFDEWQWVVRKRLKVSTTNLSEDKLKALWCAMDADDSNTLQVDELARFLNGKMTADALAADAATRLSKAKEKARRAKKVAEAAALSEQQAIRRSEREALVRAANRATASKNRAEIDKTLTTFTHASYEVLAKAQQRERLLERSCVGRERQSLPVSPPIQERWQEQAASQHYWPPIAMQRLLAASTLEGLEDVTVPPRPKRAMNHSSSTPELLYRGEDDARNLSPLFAPGMSPNGVFRSPVRHGRPSSKQGGDTLPLSATDFYRLSPDVYMAAPDWSEPDEEDTVVPPSRQTGGLRLSHKDYRRLSPDVVLNRARQEMETPKRSPNRFIASAKQMPVPCRAMPSAPLPSLKRVDKQEHKGSLELPPWNFDVTMMPGVVTNKELSAV